MQNGLARDNDLRPVLRADVTAQSLMTKITSVISLSKPFIYFCVVTLEHIPVMGATSNKYTMNDCSFQVHML